MPIIDSQVHAYERNHPGRPWQGTLVGPAEVTGDQMVAAMDAVGVDGAMLVSPFSMYRYDASYALEVCGEAPRPVRPGQAGRPERSRRRRDDRRLGGDRRHGRHPHHDARRRLDRSGRSRLNRVLPAAAQHSLPVNLLVLGPAGAGRAAGGAQPEHAAGDRPSRPAAAVRAAAAGASPGPICRRCWRWRRTRTSRSRSAAPARCRTSRSPTTTSGTRSAASSTPSASTAACGAPTGPAPSSCLTYKEGVEAFRVTDRLVRQRPRHADGRQPDPRL